MFSDAIHAFGDNLPLLPITAATITTAAAGLWTKRIMPFAYLYTLHSHKVQFSFSW